MPPRRKDRYREDEIKDILQRAAELQRRQVSTGDSGVMSLAEIEQAADEAGIERSLVRRAAAELGQIPAHPHHSAWLGGPTSIVLEASVEGEVPASAYESLVTEARRRIGAMGNVSVLGCSLAWTVTPAQGMSSRSVYLTVEANHGWTTLHLEENFRHLAGGLFGGLIGGLGGGGSGFAVSLGILVSHSPLVIPLALGAWLGGVYVLTRQLYGHRTRARERELRLLLARLVKICERSVQEPA